METTIKNEEPQVQSNEEVAKELLKIWEEMDSSTQNWNTDLVSSAWTDDYVNLPAYGVTQNKQESLDFVTDIAINNRWEFVEFKPLELFVENDIAFEFSLLEHNVTPNDGGETVNTKMRCCTVYKRVDGKWKIHRWMPQYSNEL